MRIPAKVIVVFLRKTWYDVLYESLSNRKEIFMKIKAEKGKYYITTAIAYTSRKPHIGNTYEIVFSDAIARFKKLEGHDVFFCTGTDEHGQKIQQNAEEMGVTPKAWVDRVSGEVRGIWDLMNTSYDHFIRTTDDYHEKQVQKIFKKFYDQGDIYKSEYEGWYCVPCESFFTETQLVDGKCPDCGRPVQKTKEESYFFKMSKYQDWLLQYIEEHPDFICPEARKKEMVNNFLKPGLQDLCVSRTSFTWGIQVDFDPKHVVYVWLDALTNYITALGYDVDNPSEQFNKYWPADVHIIGKDILRFHTIYWPIFLKALGLPMPKQVFGHPWLLMNGSKMSKSIGNVMYADDLVRYFSVDGVRYYLLREMPYANDGNITYEDLINRYNSDLANTIGNLVNRTISMNKKYFGSVVQASVAGDPLDEDVKAQADQMVQNVIAKMDEFRTADALEEITSFARRLNKYIDETTPWTLGKNLEDPQTAARLGTVLYTLLEGIRYIGVLLTPFLPETGAKIIEQLGVSAELTTLESLETFGALPAGMTTGEASPLFARIDEKKLMEQVEADNKQAEEAKEAEEAPIEHKPEITIDEFDKVELRVGEVIACERVKKAKKLLVSQIKIGSEVRQIVSGIAKFYDPEQFVGKKVVVVTNLKPVTLCGVESQGMILCADYTEDGADKFCVVTPEQDITSGGEVH